MRGLIGGWADFCLSRLGRRQAECLASRLKDEFGGASCALACSDLKRATQTAEAIGQALGITPRSLPELREHGCGVADGMPQAEARRHFIQPTEPLADWAAYPGGEPWRRVHARVIPCVERLIQEERDLVLVVSHKIPIHLTLCWWLGLGLERHAQVWFDVDPASISTLRLAPWGGHTVERVNDTTHLVIAGLGEEGT